MIISTTENQAWRELSAVDKKGIELSIVGERQVIRGFGTCFSELSALALDSIGAVAIRLFCFQPKRRTPGRGKHLHISLSLDTLKNQRQKKLFISFDREILHLKIAVCVVIGEEVERKIACAHRCSAIVEIALVRIKKLV